MKIRAFPPPSGTSMWRLYDPFKYLQRRGIDAHIIDTGISEEVIVNNDIFVLNNVVDMEGIALLYTYQQERGKKIVVDMDDRVEIEEDSPFILEHKLARAPEVVKKTLEIADLVTTTNEFLASKLEQYNKNVVILPNFPDLERWDLPVKYKNDSDMLRIGWCGSVTHMKDLEMIAPAVKKIMDDHKNTQLVIVGETRVKDLFKGYNIEVQYGVPWDVWPTKLSGLRLDIGLAPLVHSDFNKCKSPIKFYEYALNMIPGIYSPTVYDFQSFDGRFGLVAQDVDHWYRSLKNMVEFPVLREDISNRAYRYVAGGARNNKGSCSLEKHIDEWVKAYSSLLN